MSLPMATLRSGKKLPLLAFGCGTALYGKDSTNAVNQAITSGFNFLDAASGYANSESIGQALTQNSSKEKMIILDKISDLKRIQQVAMEEKEKLKIDKFDALLLHSPPRGKDGKPSNVDAWKIMEKLKDDGIADIIGVSNWLSSDIEEVVNSKPKHAIEINQIEYHPLIASTQKYKKLIQVCKKEEIIIMTYSSLAPITKFSDKSGPLLSVLDQIAAKEQGWSKGIVLQKWASQHGATSGDAIITSTSNKKDRLKEYLSTFTTRQLSSDELDEITKAGEKLETSKVYMLEAFDQGE